MRNEKNMTYQVIETRPYSLEKFQKFDLSEVYNDSQQIKIKKNSYGEQYTKSQNRYAPETKQLKIKGVKYSN